MLVIIFQTLSSQILAVMLSVEKLAKNKLSEKENLNRMRRRILTFANNSRLLYPASDPITCKFIEQCYPLCGMRAMSPALLHINGNELRANSFLLLYRGSRVTTLTIRRNWSARKRKKTYTRVG